MSGRIEARSDIQRVSSERQAELVQAAKDAMISNHLTESVDHLVRASKDVNFTSGNEQQTRLKTKPAFFKARFLRVLMVA